MQTEVTSPQVYLDYCTTASGFSPFSLPTTSWHTDLQQNCCLECCLRRICTKSTVVVENTTRKHSSSCLESCESEQTARGHSVKKRDNQTRTTNQMNDHHQVFPESYIARTKATAIVIHTSTYGIMKLTHILAISTVRMYFISFLALFSPLLLCGCAAVFSPLILLVLLLCCCHCFDALLLWSVSYWAAVAAPATGTTSFRRTSGNRVRTRRHARTQEPLAARSGQ